MKTVKIQYPLTSLALLTAGMSVILMVKGLPLFAGVCCIAALLMCFKEVKTHSAALQFIGVRIILLTLGIIMDSFYQGFPYYTLLFLLLPQALILRLELFNVFHLGNYYGVEIVSILSVYLVYLIANLQHPTDWRGWAIPALPMVIASFISTGIVAGAIKNRKQNREGYRVSVGQEAPGFSLVATDGETVSLSDFKGEQAVLLIFVRGDWCPSCHIMMRAYEKSREKFQEKNVVVIVIGPDPLGVNREMAGRLGLKNYILSDENQAVSREYGIKFNENNSNTNYEEGVPLPASFLVDKNGIMRYATRADRAGELLNPSQIFPILENI